MCIRTTTIRQVSDHWPGSKGSPSEKKELGSGKQYSRYVPCLEIDPSISYGPQSTPGKIHECRARTNP